MPFLIDTLTDPERAEARETMRPLHLAYLVRKADIVLAAGAKLEDDGSLGSGSFYLIDVETREDAEAFLRADPYAEAGLIRAATLVRVRKGFFDRQQIQGSAAVPR
jgi:uncharacterized protein